MPSPKASIRATMVSFIHEQRAGDYLVVHAKRGLSIIHVSARSCAHEHDGD